MGVLLSILAERMGIQASMELINEKEFDCFARITTKVDGKKCVFISDEKYINELDNSVSMVITHSDIADVLKETDYGFCITDNVRGLYFELLSFYMYNG